MKATSAVALRRLPKIPKGNGRKVQPSIRFINHLERNNKENFNETKCISKQVSRIWDKIEMYNKSDYAGARKGHRWSNHQAEMCIIEKIGDINSELAAFYFHGTTTQSTRA